MASQQLIESVIKGVVINEFVRSYQLCDMKIQTVLKITEKGGDYWIHTTERGGINREFSFNYPCDTKKEAAIAAIKSRGIVAVGGGYAVIKKPLEATLCRKCKYFAKDVSWCAVNPSFLGKPNKCSHMEVE